MSGIRYLSGRGQFIGIGIAWPTNVPPFGIPLDPAQYSGAIVWTKESVHYWSDGTRWNPLLELPIDTPYIIAPSNAYEQRQIRLTQFNSQQGLEHGSTTFQVYPTSSIEGVPIEFTITRDELGAAWLEDEKNRRTITFDEDLSAGDVISKSLQEFGFSFGDTFYVRGRYESDQSIASRWSPIAAQTLPQRIEKPAIRIQSGITTEKIITKIPEIGYNDPGYFVFDGLVYEIYENINEVGLVEPIVKKEIYRDSGEGNESGKQFAEAQLGEIFIDTSSLQDGQEYYYRILHLASSRLFGSSGQSEYRGYWTSEWSDIKSFYPLATSIVLKINNNFGSGANYGFKLIGANDLAGTIFWGDNTSVTIDGPGEYVHEYDPDLSQRGEKTIVISLDATSKGKLQSINDWSYTVADTTYRTNFGPKLIEVLALGEDMGINNLDFSFAYSPNLLYLPSALPRTTNEAGDISYVTSLEGAFRNCTSLTNPRIEFWDVSRVTDFASLFDGCTNFNLDISQWDVSSGLYFGAMFRNCRVFNANIGIWELDTNVISIGSMFEGARSFNQPVNSWGPSLKTLGSYNSVFMGAKSFNQDLDQWFTEDHIVRDITQFLYNNVSFNDAENRAVYNRKSMSLWDVSSIEDGYRAFRNQQFLEFDISEWNLENLEIGREMFYDCDRFTGSPNNEDGIKNLRFDSLRDAYLMFNRTDINGDVSNWFVNDNNLLNANGMFYNCPKFEGKGLEVWDTSKIQQMDRMFYLNESLTADLSSWDISSVGTDGTGGTHYMFYGAPINFDFSNWDFTNVKRIYGMFRGCKQLGSDPAIDNNIRKMLDPNQPGSLTLENITNLEYLFAFTDYFNEDLSAWDTSNVTRMQNIFRNAAAFNNGGDVGKQLNPMPWNVSNVTDFRLMFYNATAFNQDLSGWDVSSGIYFDSMFTRYRPPTTITNIPWFGYINVNDDAPYGQDLSGWRLDNAISCSNMFYAQPKINFDPSDWFVAKTDNPGTYADLENMSSMFRVCSIFNAGDAAGVNSNKMQNWPVSKVRSFVRTFENNNNFNQDISTWDVSGCKDFRWMFYGADKFNFGQGQGEGGPGKNPIDNWIMDGNGHPDSTRPVQLDYMFGACYNFNQNLDRVAIYWDKNPAINYPGIESLNHLLAYSHRWNNGYGNRVTPDGTDGEINWSLSNLKGINSAFRIWDYRNDAALALKININAPLLADCANMFRGHKWYSEQTALVDNLKFWFRKYPNTFSLANWFYGDRNTTSGNFDPALLSEIYQQWCLDVLQDDALTKKPGIQTRIPIHMGQSKYITDVVFVGGRTVQQVLDILQKNAAEGGQFEWVITDGGSAS